MHLDEGQLYEGTISISGGDGPFRRWIVVSPFGKTHIHSIDEPLEMRCWPAALVESGIESGRLRYVGRDPEHPAVQVQRIKERLDIPDAHLSLSKQCLDRLIGALRDAVEEDSELAPYIAGEILSAAAHSALVGNQREDIQVCVRSILDIETDIDAQVATVFTSELGAAPLST